MKSIIVRSVASIVIGALLVSYPDQMTIWLVLLIGFLFLAPGVFSIVTYWTMRSQVSYRPVFPLAGLGSTLLGLWMIITPDFFIRMSMYALGVLLIIAAVNQFASNLNARKFAVVPVFFYIMPVLFILAGVYVLLNPIDVAGLPFYILGISMIVYGIVELWHYFWINAKTRKIPPVSGGDVVDAEIVE